MFILQMPDNVSLERDSQGRMTCEVCGYKTTVSVMSNICFWTVFILKHWTKVHVFNAKRVSLSRIRLLAPNGIQASPYTHAGQNRLLFAKRQRGIFRLHVGCANTQCTSGIFSPVWQWPGQDKWYAATKSEMTANAGNRTRISRSRVSILND